MTIVRLLAGGAGLLLMAGCALAPGGPGVGPDPGAVRERLVRDEAAVRTVRASARADAAGSGGSGSAAQAIALALPDRARLETLTPLGTTALVLVIRGTELRVHSPVRKEFGFGPATAETLGRLVHVVVPPQALLRLLAGLPPFPVRTEDPRTLFTADRGTVRIDAVDGTWWERLWTGTEDPAVLRGEIGQASGVLLRFGYGDRRPLGPIAFPFTIWVEDATRGARLALTYERVRLNEPIEDALFDLPFPTDGSRVFQLEAGALPEGFGSAPGRP
jgi:hypothetical protein